MPACADESFKAGPQAGALASLAKSKIEVSEKLTSSIDELRKEPAGVVDLYSIWVWGVFASLFNPGAAWFSLATNLAIFLNGNATGVLKSYVCDRLLDTGFNSTNDATVFIQLNDGVAGPEHWPPNHHVLVELLRPVINQTIFSGYADLYFAKALWTVPCTHSFVPKPEVETAHPLLILPTSYDPVAPLISARSANHAFKRPRIVEVTGYGHTTFSVLSTCVARHARAFYEEGKIPDENAVYSSDGKPYFPKPGKDSQAMLLEQFEDEEERKIYLVQMGLAETPWPGPGGSKFRLL